MKASINIDKTAATPKLFGTLGVINKPYTAAVALTGPDDRTDNFVVPDTGTDQWEFKLTNCPPGEYEALIHSLQTGAFESTRLSFTL
ncbi:hypothetical protein [Pseudomonas sp. Teo4]|uniref:hypothetical protein n=1 Tax=Pseudomonas sp. Teo4 TaxID=3064528 RepID=UPI002ABC624E|nr:hypothetical protein [Pseudomonas sp. Teo4]MDZ3994062.1 hypothetical protein [Pseudomonas sp. Teo4]